MPSKENVFRVIGAPFRLVWSGLRQIASLTPAQIKSLVTVAFLAGIIALSVENWMITFAADHASHQDGEGAERFFSFLTERMRYLSALQGWFAAILGAVILGADYVSLKLGEYEAKMGKGED